MVYANNTIYSYQCKNLQKNDVFVGINALFLSHRCKQYIYNRVYKLHLSI